MTGRLPADIPALPRRRCAVYRSLERNGGPTRSGLRKSLWTGRWNFIRMQSGRSVQVIILRSTMISKPTDGRWPEKLKVSWRGDDYGYGKDQGIDKNRERGRP